MPPLALTELIHQRFLERFRHQKPCAAVNVTFAADDAFVQEEVVHVVVIEMARERLEIIKEKAEVPSQQLWRVQLQTDD